jgi:hypothetical protein
MKENAIHLDLEIGLLHGKSTRAVHLRRPWLLAVVPAVLMSCGGNQTHVSSPGPTLDSPPSSEVEAAEANTAKPYCKAGKWQNEILAEDGMTGIWPTIAIDAHQEVHLVHYFWSRNKLEYLSKPTGQDWSDPEELNDIAEATFRNARLLLDSRGHAHLVYYDDKKGVVKYATRPPSGPWGTPEALSLSGRPNEFPVLAVGPQGGLYLVYFARDEKKLMYTHKPEQADAWSEPEPIGGSEKKIDRFAMAVDAEGDMHLGYYDGTSHDVEYTHKTAGKTEAASVAIGKSSWGGGPAMAFDSTGKLHFLYHGESGELIYTYKSTGGSWHKPQVMDMPRATEYTSMAIDGNDRIHLAFYSEDQPGLWYTSKAAAEQIWQPPERLVEDNGGKHVSLAFDEATDTVHIAYHFSKPAGHDGFLGLMHLSRSCQE